jgi:hypothetical protein
VFEATVHFAYHPLSGKRVRIVGTKRHPDEEHLLLEQPDGTKAYIPARMIDPAWANVEPEVMPRLEVAALEDLRRLLDNIVSSPAFRSAVVTAKKGGT